MRHKILTWPSGGEKLCSKKLYVRVGLAIFFTLLGPFGLFLQRILQFSVKSMSFSPDFGAMSSTPQLRTRFRSWRSVLFILCSRGSSPSLSPSTGGPSRHSVCMRELDGCAVAASRSSSKNCAMPSGVRMMAGVSAKGISRRYLVHVLEIGVEPLVSDGERVCDPPRPFMPFIRGRATPVGGRSEGIGGSVRSLRSVMYFSRRSALTFKRFTHGRRGWFCIQ